MQVHEIVNDAALEVVLNSVDDDLLANVHDFEVRVLIFVSVLVNCLVNLLVITDAVEKVLGSSFRVLTPVVRAGRFDIANVCHDDVLIVTLALDKKYLDAMLNTDFVDPFPALLGRIGSVEYCDDASGAKPSKHVGDGSLGSGTALPLALGVVGVEEVSGGLWRIVAPIIADVESLRWYGQPLEVALSFEGGMG